MATETWHSSFNPQKFLSRVDLDRLIERNDAYNESKTSHSDRPCILPLLLVHIGLVVVPLVLFVVSSAIDSAQDKKRLAWLKLKEEWERDFPEPAAPTLRHFHHPQVRLTERDRKILKIFNNWPGYPPFWNYLREVVLSRDGNHCQVSGCPSRVALHIHHRTPVAKGGKHIPDNLVSLCDFHHALEPEEGHERIWGSIKTRYFTIVKAHTRHNRASAGYHDVRAHVRRLELAKSDELNEIKRYYSLSCPECGSENITISVAQRVNVECASCNKRWSGPKELTEETGPRLAELLTIKRNKGIWKPRWDMLSTRTDNVFSSLSATKRESTKSKKRKRKKKTVRTVQAEEKPLCPKCGSPMKMVTPKPGQRWKKFWGCTKYWSDGCRGSRKL